MHLFSPSQWYTTLTIQVVILFVHNNKSLTLHIGQREKVKVMRGPGHLRLSTLRQQWAWNTWPHSSCQGTPFITPKFQVYCAYWSAFKTKFLLNQWSSLPILKADMQSLQLLAQFPSQKRWRLMTKREQQEKKVYFNWFWAKIYEWDILPNLLLLNKS